MKNKLIFQKTETYLYEEISTNQQKGKNNMEKTNKRPITKTRVNFTLDKGMIIILQDYCRKHLISYSTFVNHLIVQFFSNKQDNQ